MSDRPGAVEAQLEAMRVVLRPHVGHTVTVNGWERTVTEGSLAGDKVGWCYAGFAVDCRTCTVSLSGQWS